eukprot:1102432-Alexandrium_andersonii.AAC.1
MPSYSQRPWPGAGGCRCHWKPSDRWMPCLQWMPSRTRWPARLAALMSPRSHRPNSEICCGLWCRRACGGAALRE